VGNLTKAFAHYLNRRLWVILPLIAVLAVACGAAEEPAAAPAAEQQEAAPTATFAPQMIPVATAVPAAPAAADQSSGGQAAQPAPAQEQPAPTAAPVVAEAPASADPAKNHATIVTEAEPASVGMWSEGCSAEIHSMGCTDFVSDFLTWLDDRTAEIVPLSGVVDWEQIDLDRWQFNLRDGVKFHNGAPWNAAAAKYGIEYNANPENPSASVTWTGPFMEAEVIDDLTVHAVCPNPCPIYPRTALFSDFQDPGWFESATEEERSLNSIGFGPYKIIGYEPGVNTQFEIYENYLPNENWFSQAPTIQFITHTYRAEAPVRSAMIQTGEAHWAADIGFEEVDNVVNAGGKTVSGKTAEVYTLVFDTVFHDELAKKEVRLALTHAVDCQTLLDSMFGGRIPCHNAISMNGTVGITAENSKWREYDPELARELLAEAGYDPDNEININTRPGSNIRGLEIMEATIQYWRDVGVNANLNSHGDLGAAREIQSSGCGQFTNEPGYKEAMDCSSREPPGPAYVTSHAYEVATSNEILDMQRFNNSRLSCFSRSSRHCTSEFEAWKTEANSIPEGPERTKAMEEIADFAYEEAIFLPFFEVVYVYGLAGDIEWQPYYAPRLRGNTMRFTE
jgi:peptide/nickel transport system substrate-binding protein